MSGPENGGRAGRDGKGRFVPGVAANPGGRPKSADLAALCRGEVHASFENLKRLAKGRGSVAYRATELILAYACGRPMASVDIELSGPDGGPVQLAALGAVMTSGEVRARLRELEAAAEARRRGLPPAEPPVEVVTNTEAVALAEIPKRLPALSDRGDDPSPTPVPPDPKNGGKP